MKLAVVLPFFSTSLPLLFYTHTRARAPSPPQFPFPNKTLRSRTRCTHSHANYRYEQLQREDLLRDYRHLDLMTSTIPYGDIFNVNAGYASVEEIVSYMDQQARQARAQDHDSSGSRRSRSTRKGNDGKGTSDIGGNDHEESDSSTGGGSGGSGGGGSDGDDSSDPMLYVFDAEVRPDTHARARTHTLYIRISIVMTSRNRISVSINW